MLQFSWEFGGGASGQEVLLDKSIFLIDGRQKASGMHNLYVFMHAIIRALAQMWLGLEGGDLSHYLVALFTHHRLGCNATSEGQQSDSRPDGYRYFSRSIEVPATLSFARLPAMRLPASGSLLTTTISVVGME